MTMKGILKKTGLLPMESHQVLDLFASKVYSPHEEAQHCIYEKVKDQTLIRGLGILANMDAVDYICGNNLPGCIVECGVWKGGSVAAILLRLLDHGVLNRSVYLFDTFAGMTEPTEVDKTGEKDAMREFANSQEKSHNAWCYSPLEEVKKNIDATGYPSENVHYVKGDVLETIPRNNPPDIALLRLDTDWYESTKVELQYLYPKVVDGGVVIVDDYGTWEGARKAVDEYFQDLSFRPLMSRVDHARRMFVKFAR